MQKTKRILALFLAVLMVLSFAACKNKPGNDETPDGDNTGDGSSSSYTVSIKSIGGMPISGVDVYVFADDTLTDLKQAGKTDDSGNVSFNLPTSNKYAVSLSGVAKGYKVEPYYSFSGNSAVITLKSELVTGESLSSATLGLGDVMYDFSVNTPDGETVTLSEVLKTKKAVLINFWYTTCSWCLKEFPYMEEAYQMYQDDLEIIAVNPMGEGAATVKTFQEQNALSFIMAECPTAWSQTFGITGYPTSIMIDRYGVICLIEAGGITSLRPFTSMFEHFTATEYTQKICTNGLSDLVTQVKPDVTMPSSEEISAVISNGNANITYRAEADPDAAEYTWPFVIGEKDGVKCIMSSNSEVDSSYAILYIDVQLKKGEAVKIDYMVSSESGADVMHIIVDNEPIYQISGYNEVAKWETCYPCVAEEDGTYEVAVCYIKDESDNVGDDRVYIRDVKIVNQSEIVGDAFLPREAATTKDDGLTYEYVDIFYNESDMYYHVGSVNGPLLLANLITDSLFTEESTIHDLVYNNTNWKYGDQTLYDAMVKYFSMASNSAMSGVCTVDKGLMEFLKEIDRVAGFDDNDDNEWLKICKYYQSYGTSGKQLDDPIKGLAPFNAYKATLGKNVSTNYFYYDRGILPRGLLAEFIPTTTGVYRITSHNESVAGVDAWIFDANHEILLTHEPSERLNYVEGEATMVYYMEAGTPYYIDIAFWDMYETGYIYYDVEYVAPTLELFRLCSPGYFTYDTNATGDAMYYVIAGGIKAVLGDDGYYYEDLGNGKKGSKIYADFTGLTSIFDKPIATVNAYDANGNIIYGDDGKPEMVEGMIDLKGFDFTKTEDDLFVLAYIEKHNGDVDAVKEDLKKAWGDSYESYYVDYKVDEVLAGKYHGTGKDLTAEISKYVDKIITTGSADIKGCVAVDKELAEILQQVMDKYTFENVEQSWLKLCYYYDYFGPEQGR